MVGTHLDLVQGAACRQILYLQGRILVSGQEILDLPLVLAVAGEHAVARSLLVPVQPGGWPAQG